MKLFDKIATSGFLGSFGLYYLNKDSEFIQDFGITGELYDWTIGGFPEFFTGMLGVRIAYHTGNFLKINQNLTVLSSSATILGLGILDETLNLTSETQDLEDIIKYGLGVGLSSYYSLKKNQ